jgi:hypothetical protein
VSAQAGQRGQQQRGRFYWQVARELLFGTQAR